MPVLNDALSEFARAIVKGDEPSPLSLSAGLNYSLETALAVYRNNYRGNLHDALAGAYPVLEQLVGNDFFRLLTREFIEQHLSHGGNLHHYGSEMSAFVAIFEPAQGLPYLADVAALEWACHNSYFAEDGDSLDIAKLAQVPPEKYSDLILHLHTACHLARSPYPVAAIWHAHQPGAASNFQIDLDSGASNALVIRQADAVIVCELSAAAAAWLQEILAGTPLGVATAITLERYSEFDLQATLLSLVAQDVFTSFSLNTLP